MKLWKRLGDGGNRIQEIGNKCHKNNMIASASGDTSATEGVWAYAVWQKDVENNSVVCLFCGL